MISEVFANGKSIKYDLQYKKVRNINLRIKRDGSIYVSANKKIPKKFIDEFVISKSEFIVKTLDKFERTVENVALYSENELKTMVISMCEKVYPYYAAKGISRPQIKFRKMVSQWGNCRAARGILTFNTNLMFAPRECIEYVVLHEFTHFLQQNHSAEFYDELEKVCPDWKIKKNKLKEIVLKR